MKTPWYETSAGALVNLLLTKSFISVDLYTFTLSTGEVLKYATGVVPVLVPGYGTWDAQTVLVEVPSGSSNGTAHWKAGVDVDTWQVAMVPRPVGIDGTLNPDTIGTVPFLQAVRLGFLDEAQVQVDRAFFPTWPGGAPQSMSPVGVITLFFGEVAAVDIMRSQAIVSINSHLDILSTAMPKNVWQAGCRHRLFDSGCGLSAAAFKMSGTATGGSGNTFTSAVAAPGGSGTYTLGRIVMTSGANDGFSRTVRLWSSGTFTLLAPFPFTVQAGDTFDAYPGCNKTMATCTAFANLDNYGGEPFVPVPETAV